MGTLVVKNELIMRYEDVKGFEGLYYVTEDGMIHRYLRMFFKRTGELAILPERTLISTKCMNGYRKVNLRYGEKTRTCYVHRLVVEAFLKNPLGLPMVNHKDFNKENNCLENLEYCSARYNSIYSSKACNHSSKYVGVTWDKKRRKWQAQYQVGRKKVFLGRYDTQEEAHEAYVNAFKIEKDV